jgi:type IV pilus assembly protein PilO
MANFDLKNPTIQKTVLGVLLSGGLLAVFFFTHFLPFGYPNQQDRLNVLKTDYERKSTELARARTTVADLPRFESEYEQLHDRWQLAAELLPTDRQLGSLLRKITLAGQETGVQFVRFRPSPPKTDTYYTEIGSFLAELANMRRIVTVADMRLKTNPAMSTNPLATTAIELTASAYSLNTSSTVAPAKGARKEGGPNARKSS